MGLDNRIEAVVLAQGYVVALPPHELTVALCFRRSVTASQVANRSWKLFHSIVAIFAL